MEVFTKAGKYLGSLRVIDPKSSYNWARAYVGDHVSYDVDSDRYVMGKEDFLFWERACRVQNDFDNAFYSFGANGREILYQDLHLGENDLETDISIMESFLDRKFQRDEDYLESTVSFISGLEPNETGSKIGTFFELQKNGLLPEVLA